MFPHSPSPSNPLPSAPAAVFPPPSVAAAAPSATATAASGIFPPPTFLPPHAPLPPSAWGYVIPPSEPHTLATAVPPVRPQQAAPSPISSSLRQQITGNYVDLATLLRPSMADSSQPREIITPFGITQLRSSKPAHSRELTPVEFAYSFSLYRDTLCSIYPERVFDPRPGSRPALRRHWVLPIPPPVRFPSHRSAPSTQPRHVLGSP